MALITDSKPDESIPMSPGTNDLNNLPDDLLQVPAAYLVFGSSPDAFENPPTVDDVRTYVVRTVCTGVHGPIKRKDGELRYTRTLSVIGCWESGKQPPNADANQSGLIDSAGNLNPAACADNGEERPEPEDLDTNEGDLGDDPDGDAEGYDGGYGPEFSGAGDDQG